MTYKVESINEYRHSKMHACLFRRAAHSLTISHCIPSLLTRHLPLSPIQVGDGLPDIVHTSVCTAALEKVGFDVSEARDVALDQGYCIEQGEPWCVRCVAC